MALVICDMSISLDGYVTGPNDSRENPFGDGAGMLHDWMFDAATDDDRAILQEILDGAGTLVMGRKSFGNDEGDGGWGDSGPRGDTPCFVVTHNHIVVHVARRIGHVAPRQGGEESASPVREPVLPATCRWIRRVLPCIAVLRCASGQSCDVLAGAPP